MNRNKVRSNTNRKMDLKKKMTAGLAVGMAGLMGTTPVFAAEPADKKVSKDETVYVNADAQGTEQEITVSNWLKNAGAEKNLKDETELENVKNVKAGNWNYSDTERARKSLSDIDGGGQSDCSRSGTKRN